mmetsp:Transcript_17858/g.57854  ORF Transcript_17858/g.57854 Transcript_17858/m.57854 type:complete len:236 (-) Transcript_17858:1980-2687(-)
MRSMSLSVNPTVPRSPDSADWHMFECGDVARSRRSSEAVARSSARSKPIACLRRSFPLRRRSGAARYTSTASRDTGSLMSSRPRSDCLTPTVVFSFLNVSTMRAFVASRVGASAMPSSPRCSRASAAPFASVEKSRMRRRRCSTIFGEHAFCARMLCITAESITSSLIQSSTMTTGKRTPVAISAATASSLMALSPCLTASFQSRCTSSSSKGCLHTASSLSRRRRSISLIDLVW